MCLHYHGEVSVVCLWDILLVLAQFNGDNVAKMRTRIIPGNKISHIWGVINNWTNLDPAMNPRMGAFSGLVTLLAVLNIS